MISKYEKFLVVIGKGYSCLSRFLTHFFPHILPFCIAWVHFHESQKPHSNRLNELVNFFLNEADIARRETCLMFQLCSVLFSSFNNGTISVMSKSKVFSFQETVSIRRGYFISRSGLYNLHEIMFSVYMLPPPRNKMQLDERVANILNKWMTH